MRERAARVAAALAALALCAAGAPVRAAEPGEPVDGLTVALAAAERVWPAGTAMAFEATLRNVSERVFLIDLFGDLDELYQGKRREAYVTSCWALVWEGGPVAVEGPRRGRYTLAREQFARLLPGESHTARLTRTLPADTPPGTYRLRLAYIPRAAASSFSFPDRWQEQHELRDPMWLGMAWSNEVTVEVAGAQALRGR